MIAQIIAAYFSTLGFCYLFSAPKQEIFIVGVVGAISWFVYLASNQMGCSVAVSVFIACLVITYVSRILSYYRKCPIIIFLIAGIIPVVPGAGIYDTMYLTITNQPILAIAKGIETFKVSGVIAISIILVLSLPQNFFRVPLLVKKD